MNRQDNQETETGSAIEDLTVNKEKATEVKGGIGVLMGDGSVRHVSYSVAPAASGTAADELIIGTGTVAAHIK